MSSLVFLIFPALMIVAAICDVRSFLIPNRVTAAIAAAWPFAVLLAGMGMMDAMWSVLLAGGVLFFCFGLFAFGWLGGGDAKLLAVTTLWIGPAVLPAFLFVTVMAGAGLAIVLLTFRRFPLPVMASTVGWVSQLHERKRDIPYGVAIAAGAIYTWPATAFFPF
ncbi:A24 family peptidase [Parvularcula marina]|uniref:Prepilin type IV endopeptidase peptidase domain-containing protein n=1 Tax=Parvularcula marina TaxID=2292771 RepID=A0A371RK34_9PROT|nr:prepilin peptidase [Parvularcula marina]RFB05776.1 hypothetical protein DX908_11160 [Parvularcula marina]